jgi:outer membrane protein assembly factor BamE (lipoprotein component of BamABCDE complex)
MKRPSIPTTAAAASLVALSLAATGCLVAGDNDIRVTGTRVSAATLSTIEPGTTTETEVLALLGEPTRTVRLNEKRVLVYEYERVEDKDTAIFLVFGGSSSKTEKQTTYIEVDSDGTVSRAWTDDA